MATVTSQLTRIHDVEGALTLTSIGGGAGAVANTEIFIQGAQSAGRKQSNAADHGFWLTVGSQNVSGAGVHVGIWIQHIHYAVLTKFAMRLGSTIANYHEHAFPLASWPKVGGWLRTWINVGRTPEAQAGTFDKATLTQVAVLASLPAVGGNAPNLIMDASDFATAGLLLTGTAGVFSDFVAADEDTGANKYGVVITQSGVIYCLARLTFGSASSLVFNDSDFVIVFPDQSLVASTFMGISVDLQTTGTNIDWARGVVRSAGTVKGDLVVTGTTGTFDVLNSTLASLRIITLTSTCTLDGCLISGSGLISAAGAIVKNCTILNATDTAALFWNTAVDTNAKLDNTKFTSGGTGHAFEFGPNTPSTITLSGVKFTGYGAAETTNAAVFNNAGKALTINISGGGDIPTVRNGAGASTTINTSVNLTLTVKDTLGANIQSARSFISKSAQVAMQGAVADDGGVETDETTASNNATANDMTLLPVVPVTGDAYNFGAKNPFWKLTLNIGTPGVGTWTIAWKYWNGAWTTIPSAGFSDGTKAFQASAGNRDVVFTPPSDWTAKTIQGISGYFIRADVAFTSITTQPKGTQAWVWEQLMNTTTNASGVATTTYNYLGDVAITYDVRKSSTGATKYIPVTGTGTIASTGFSATVTMTTDDIAEA